MDKVIFKEGDVLNLRKLRDGCAAVRAANPKMRSVPVYVSLDKVQDMLELPTFRSILNYRGILPKYVGELGALERAIFIRLECLEAPEGEAARAIMRERLAEEDRAWRKANGWPDA